MPVATETLWRDGDLRPPVCSRTLVKHATESLGPRTAGAAVSFQSVGVAVFLSPPSTRKSWPSVQKEMTEIATGEPPR